MTQPREAVRSTEDDPVVQTDPVSEDYRPADYWADRLGDVGGLRSTGHISYDERYNRWLYRRKGIVLRRALRDVPSVARALDVGSGVGWVVEQLLAGGATHVHGVDIAPAAVDDLRVRFPSHSFDVVRVGEEPLPLDDASRDVATFLDVAYHIVDDAIWEAAVADIGRVVAPNGSLVVIDAFGAQEQRPASHVRFRAATRWHEAAKTAGFDLVAVQPCYRWLSRSPEASVLRRVPQGVRGAVELTLDAVLPRPAHLSCALYRRRP